MHYSVLRLRDVRTAVVLVKKAQLYNDQLIRQLQRDLGHPVMLIARDDSSWKGVKVNAQFDAAPHLYELLRMENIEWAEVPEPELPF